jgi:hypothetical protein
MNTKEIEATLKDVSYLVCMTKPLAQREHGKVDPWLTLHDCVIAKRPELAKAQLCDNVLLFAESNGYVLAKEIFGLCQNQPQEKKLDCTVYTIEGRLKLTQIMSSKPGESAVEGPAESEMGPR